MIDEMPGELAILIAGELLGDQGIEAPFKLRPASQELTPAEAPRIAEIPDKEALLEQCLEISGKAHGSTTVDLLEPACSPEEVRVAHAMGGAFKAVVGWPAIAAQESRELAAQRPFDDVEAAARLDEVERGLVQKRCPDSRYSR